MPISLILGDHELLFRRAIRELLSIPEIRVVGEAADGPAALQLAATLHPDVAVLNSFLPVLNGLDAGKKIRHVSPKTGVVLLAAHLGARYIRNALTGGISGFASRAGTGTDLHRVIQQVAAGSVYMDPLVGSTKRVEEADDGGDGSVQLTARERQIVQLIAECWTTKDIGHQLGISPKTAESHRQRAMYKLQISEPAQLVRYAIRESLVEVRIPPPESLTGEEESWSTKLTREASVF